MGVPSRDVPGQGFDPEDIQRGMCDLAGVERGEQASSSIKGPRPGLMIQAPLGRSARVSALRMFSVAGVLGSKSTRICAVESAELSPSVPCRQVMPGMSLALRLQPVTGKPKLASVSAQARPRAPRPRMVTGRF